LIQQVRSFEILDSRGNPTVAAEVVLDNGGGDISLGLDLASSEFYKNGLYDLASEGKKFDSVQFTGYLAGWLNQYPFIAIEDGMAKDDWVGWQLLTYNLGHRVQLVGDGPVRDKHRHPQRGHQSGSCQIHPDQAQLDWNPDRNTGRNRHGGQGRPKLPHFPSNR
jgi:enolase